MSVLAACCDAAVVREGLHLMRRERLVSGAVLIGLFAPTALLFSLRAHFAATGQLGPELFAPNEPQLWLAITGTAFLLLRGSALLLLATERNRNALVSLAQRDSLTGALNRTGLERSLDRLAAEAVGRPHSIALLLIDIDHFKQLNDTHGHAAGDHILRLFAEAARGELRASDVLARQGGDEFVVVLPHLTAAEAIGVANRIRAAFGRALAGWGEATVQPTLSNGIGQGDAARDPLDTVLQQADEALYRSERLGRNRVELLSTAVAS
ncbi:GGDEF domain-containing protein [Bosea sp. (in: a-proteobacteria)]|uniref:GGDEF domain-containing protein n=1 Tax=Bosea sp. (in: a-proteobacteria) TaxID=1871050 RepID=UPI002FCAC57B